MTTMQAKIEANRAKVSAINAANAEYETARDHATAEWQAGRLTWDAMGEAWEAARVQFRAKLAVQGVKTAIVV